MVNIQQKGTVDFSPVRSITPGPAGHEFPPSAAQPGAIGDKDYSPFVQIVNAAGVIYNAPIVAFGVNASDITFPNGNVDYSKVHDQVVAIDPVNMTVTLNLINGFSFGRPVWYLSMDTSIPLGAAIEHNTFAPLMAALHLGGDDTFSSPIERIFISTAYLPAQSEPVVFGVHGAVAEHYRVSPAIAEPRATTLDYIVAAAAGWLGFGFWRTTVPHRSARAALKPKENSRTQLTAGAQIVPGESASTITENRLTGAQAIHGRSR